jgi:hypothetical protein
LVERHTGGADRAGEGARAGGWSATAGAGACARVSGIAASGRWRSFMAPG